MYRSLLIQPKLQDQSLLYLTKTIYFKKIIEIQSPASIHLPQQPQASTPTKIPHTLTVMSCAKYPPFLTLTTPHYFRHREMSLCQETDRISHVLFRGLLAISQAGIRNEHFIDNCNANIHKTPYALEKGYRNSRIEL